MDTKKGQYSENIKTILQNAGEAREKIMEFNREMGRIDPRVESLFQYISQRLNAIECKGKQLFSQISSEPLGKYLTGRRLSREEFYFLRSIEIPVPIIEMKNFVKVSWDEYEFFTLFYYDDGTSRCYINPNLVKEQVIENQAGITLGMFVDPE